jgi:hypothetical protein
VAEIRRIVIEFPTARTWVIASLVLIHATPAVHAKTITSPRSGLPLSLATAKKVAKPNAAQATKVIIPSVESNRNRMVQTESLISSSQLALRFRAGARAVNSQQ